MRENERQSSPSASDFPVKAPGEIKLHIAGFEHVIDPMAALEIDDAKLPHAAGRRIGHGCRMAGDLSAVGGWTDVQIHEFEIRAARALHWPVLREALVTRSRGAFRRLLSVAHVSVTIQLLRAL